MKYLQRRFTVYYGGAAYTRNFERAMGHAAPREGDRAGQKKGGLDATGETAKEGSEPADAPRAEGLGEREAVPEVRGGLAR